MNKLQQLSEIESRISQLTTVDEAKGIRDQAEALRVYAKSAGKGLVIQNKAAKIKLMAEHKAGQLIASIPRKNGETGKNGVRATLAQTDIPIQTAHRWQAIATLPLSKITELETEHNEAKTELTSSATFQLARELQGEKQRPPQKKTPDSPLGTYRAIVIDPPWPIEKIMFDRRPREKKAMDYPVLTLEQIEGLEIPKLADPDGCHIYLWATHKMIPVAFRLFEKWGVRYECLLTWNKPTAQPLWWRYLTEHCLFGKIGSLAPLKKGCAVSFSAPQQKHSHKPNQFFELVKQVSPGPRLTMFDYDRDGFQRWGVTH